MPESERAIAALREARHDLSPLVGMARVRLGRTDPISERLGSLLERIDAALREVSNA